MLARVIVQKCEKRAPPRIIAGLLHSPDVGFHLLVVRLLQHQIHLLLPAHFVSPKINNNLLTSKVAPEQFFKLIQGTDIELQVNFDNIL